MNEASVPDSVLKPLCKPFSKQADWLLELYELSRKPNEKAGSCLKCFYKLLEAADPSKREALNPLKRWIEANMVISVENPKFRNTSFPVRLDAEDFEGFCIRTINQVRSNNALGTSSLALRLKYRGERAA